MRRRLVKRAKRIVLKIGSGVLVDSGGSISPRVFGQIARQVRCVMEGGRKVVLVSSGAIATGMKALSMEVRPRSIPQRQAVAAVGQPHLMSHYARAFRRQGLNIAQILLTHDDFADRRRFINAKNTVSTLLEDRIVPVINENDSTAVDEIKFGDNDTLSALTTTLVDAELLVILSDIDGIYDKDPRVDASARRIPLIEDIDGLHIDLEGSTTGPFGTGGIASKLSAARKAAHSGCATIIASGKKKDMLECILSGEEMGTLVLPKEDRLTSKKHWIAYAARPAGKLFVDDGAKCAIMERGKSLLPTGITMVEGDFEAGEVVHCMDTEGMEFARGMVNYSAGEIRKIKGRKSREIEGILGYKVYDEVIHRDSLVIM